MPKRSNVSMAELDGKVHLVTWGAGKRRGGRIPFVHINGQPREVDLSVVHRAGEKSKELALNTYKATPKIEVKDYGKLVVGVWATVNRPYIDEAYIADFIDFYRELGEPIKPGIAWKGDEIEVIPANIYKNDRSSST